MKPNTAEIPLSNAYKILHPIPTVVVTCRSKSGRHAREGKVLQMLFAISNFFF